MSAFKIITDSCADFTTELYRQLDVTYAPLNVLLKGELHNNLIDDADVKTLYNALREGEMPTTSAANPDGWMEVMKPVLEEGKDVLCIAFSSALSTTYQSAVIAANELAEEFPDRKIKVVDSLCAALGQGYLIYHVAHWVTVDDLFHLKRGGRVSGATAVVGTMLNIKPIIHVSDEGKLVNVGKARGRKPAMDTLLKKYEELTLDREVVFIAHGDCLEDAQALEKALKEKHGVKEVHIGYVGGVIGAHTGPGVLAIFFLAEHR